MTFNCISGEKIYNDIELLNRAHVRERQQWPKNPK